MVEELFKSMLSGKKLHINLNLLPLMIGFVLSLTIFNVMFVGINTDFEELALDQETVSVYPDRDGIIIHCKGVSDSAQCINGFNQSAFLHAALWLGNSQLHAINQYVAGQKTGSYILHDKLRSFGIYLTTFSQPNSSLSEQYVLYEYLSSQVNFEYLILPLVFDDLREAELRQDIISALSSVPEASLVANPKLWHTLKNQYSSAIIEPTTKSSAVLLRDKTETYLNHWLSNNTSVWKARPEARGSIMTFLYRLRNTVFGITASTKRPMIKTRYEQNILALKELLSSAEQKGTKIVMYIAPIRNDVSLPYIDGEYLNFKKQMSEISTHYNNVLFISLEDIVTASLWGQKDSTIVGGTKEIDYMHFQAAGHKILAEHLFSAVKKLH